MAEGLTLGRRPEHVVCIKDSGVKNEQVSSDLLLWKVKSQLSCHNR